MARPAILLLAAGAARRMGGRDKLMEPVEGVPLLRRQARAALDSGCPVIVTLPDPAPARRAALDGLAVEIVAVPDAAEGMAASIRAGIAALPPDTPQAMILPADMPEITAADLAALRAAADAAPPGALLRAAAADGTPGHPVVFPSRLFPALRRLAGDTGARALLQGETPIAVPLPDRHALTDLDTPEAWAAWRAGRDG